MKTIRFRAFETNSSSTHSITFDSSYTAAPPIKGAVIRCGEFGWEYERFNDFAQKASYFWTLAQDNESLNDLLVELAEEYEFTLVSPSSEVWHYVDHGGEHYDNFVSEHPQIDSKAGLFEFLTQESFWIMLGNDNSCGPANFRLTPNQVANAKQFVTINNHPEFKYIADNVDNLQHFIRNCASDYIDHRFPYTDYKGTQEKGWPDVAAIDENDFTVEWRKYENQQHTVVRSEKFPYTITTHNDYIAPTTPL